MLLFLSLSFFLSFFSFFLFLGLVQRGRAEDSSFAGYIHRGLRFRKLPFLTAPGVEGSGEVGS